MTHEHTGQEQGGQRYNRRANGYDPDATHAYGAAASSFMRSLPESERPTEQHKTLEVVALWGDTVLSVKHYASMRPVYVGTARSCDVVLGAMQHVLPRFALVQPAGSDGVVLNLTHDMHVSVRNAQGQGFSKEELATSGRLETSAEGGAATHRYRLGLHDHATVHWGPLTFVIQYVKPARVVPVGFWKTLDYYFTKVLGITFIAHAALVLMLMLTPKDPDGLEEDLFKNPNRFAQLLLKAPEKKPVPKKIELSGAKGGGRHKDKEGKFGRPDPRNKDALASKKGAPKVDVNKREEDRKIAMQTGLFKALSGKAGTAVSNVFGPGGLGTGVNNAMGGLRGSAQGEGGGNGGLGTRGTGPGGGGDSMGIGGVGGGSGYGTGGLGNVDLGGKGRSRVAVVPGHTVTRGCLTQEVVLRVLNRVQNQAKYCYEKELTRNPNLAGKVTTAFVIGAAGAVQSVNISESTMGSPEVESCLSRVVQRLTFPPCVGGGVAEVTYPWIFKSTGN